VTSTASAYPIGRGPHEGRLAAPFAPADETSRCRARRRCRCRSSDGACRRPSPRLLDVNLLGSLALARVALPVLEEGGFLLNVSGVVAELPTAGLAAE
jgi:NAD(P)-dependent dehydrogenase (short-subunit alcohol dehydrogenase family)